MLHIWIKFMVLCSYWHVLSLCVLNFYWILFFFCRILVFVAGMSRADIRARPSSSSSPQFRPWPASSSPTNNDYVTNQLPSLGIWPRLEAPPHRHSSTQVTNQKNSTDPEQLWPLTFEHQWKASATTPPPRSVHASRAGVLLERSWFHELRTTGSGASLGRPIHPAPLESGQPCASWLRAFHSSSRSSRSALMELLFCPLHSISGEQEASALPTANYGMRDDGRGLITGCPRWNILSLSWLMMLDLRREGSGGGRFKLLRFQRLRVPVWKTADREALNSLRTETMTFKLLLHRYGSPEEITFKHYKTLQYNERSTHLVYKYIYIYTNYICIYIHIHI